MVEDQTTTISISTEVWAALDRRKNSGDSFDDIIRQLINATGIGVGELEGPHPDMEYRSVEELDEPALGKNCAHYDVVHGESCQNTPTVRQQYRMERSDEWDIFYYCNEHRPDEREH